ncbi:MAG: hypothetical protein J6M02_06070 [Clostridia bacterium]|nr:hypothetical protein [Clostridia bacterium]
MKRIFAIFLSGMVFMSGFSTSFAALPVERKETVYVNLNYDGTVDEINVFNDCHVADKISFEDYGEYESVQNLTDRSEIKKDDEKYIVNAGGASRFLYSGKVGNEKAVNIPWNIKVTYYLNGLTINPHELLHKSGLVKIEVEITPNTSADAFYRNNYMLEATASYDMSQYTSVSSKEAIELVTGNTKTLMFIALPGQETSFAIEIGSDDFEMDGLIFAMVPLEGDIFEELADLTEDKDDIESAAKAMNRSMDIIFDSMEQMNPALSELKGGLAKLNDGMDEIHEIGNNKHILEMREKVEDLSVSMKDIQKDIENIKENVLLVNEMGEEIDEILDKLLKRTDTLLKDLDDIEEILEEDLPDDLEDLSDTLRISKNLVGEMRKLLAAQGEAGRVDTDAIEEEMTALGTEIARLSQIAQTLTGPEQAEVLASVMRMNEEMTALAENLEQLSEASGSASSASNGLYQNLTYLESNLGRVQKNLDRVIDDDLDVFTGTVADFNDMGKTLKEMLDTTSKYIKKFLKNKDDIPNLLDTTQSMIGTVDSMLSLTSEMLADLDEAKKILDEELYEGSSASLSGMQSTIDALSSMTGQTSALRDSKEQMRKIIKKNWEEIDEDTNIFQIDTSMKKVSFSSEKNSEPEKVQLMLKTPEIKELKEDIADLEAESEKLNFGQRVVLIFQKIIDWIKGLFH